MKYKRRKSKVSKYISYTDDKSRKKENKKLSLKKRSSLAAALVVIAFAITRLNIADTAFVKKIFTQSGGVFAMEDIEFLNTAGDYIAEFCFGYLKNDTDSKTDAYAKTEDEEIAQKSEPEQESDISLEAEAESVQAPPAEKSGFLPSMPCVGEVSSEFGERVHPLKGEVTFHNGIDIALVEGDPITACFDGEVITSEYNDYSGNYIIIKHMDDYTSSYAHMSQLMVPVGTMVKKGDVIGLAGSTGSATGPHLHFEIRQGGTPLDPWKMVEMNN